MAITKEEIERKLLHIISGTLIPGLILYLPFIPGYKNFYSTLILLFFLLASICLEFMRFKIPIIKKIFNKFFSSMLRKEEEFKVTGSTYIFAGAFFCTLFFPNNIAAISLCLFILGDAFAAVVGISIGKIKIGKKSLEGSLACFLSCFIIMYYIFPNIPCLFDNLKNIDSLFVTFIISLTITVFELIPIKLSKNLILNDNLSVPLLTCLLIKLLIS